MELWIDVLSDVIIGIVSCSLVFLLVVLVFIYFNLLMWY